MRASASTLTCMSRAPVKRRTSSRARILESVATILESGVRYADVPVERILTTANVSRSTFYQCCLLYTSPSPRDATLSRMPSSA